MNIFVKPLLALLISLVAVTFFENSAIAEGVDFKWNPETNKCENRSGTVGLNPNYVGVCGELSKSTLPTNLRGQSLRGARLFESQMTKINLRYGDLRNTFMESAELTGADLRETDLRDAFLEYAKMSGIDLREADLRRAFLEYAVLTGADLHESDLRRAYLAYANLNGADLSGAQLDGAYLIGVIFNEKTDFTGATYTGSTKLPYSETDAKAKGMIRVGK